MSNVEFEHNVSNVFTSVIIHKFNELNWEKYPKINFNALINSFSRNETNEEREDNHKTLSPEHRKYNNIIETLEMKYCSNANFGVTSPEEPVRHEKSKTKKVKYSADYYDSEDSFIDDSDNISQIEKSVNMKLLNTKRKGFFVSSGELEVETQSSKIAKNSDCNRIATNHLATIHTTKEEISKVNSKSFVSDWKMSDELTVAFQQFRDRVLPLIGEPTPSANATAIAPATTSASATSNSNNNNNSTITPNAKLTLKNIPLELYEPLQILDDFMLQHNTGRGSSVNNNSKYIETLTNICMNRISANKFRNHILKSRLDEKVRISRDIMLRQEEELTRLIRASIVSIVPSSNNNNNSSSKSSDTGASTSAVIDVSPEHERDSKRESPAIIGSSTTMKSNGNSYSNGNCNGNGNGNEVGSTAKSSEKFMWVCKWNAKIREELYQGENNVEKYVKYDTQYKKLLDSKGRADEGKLLDPKEFIQSWLQRLSDKIFASPYEVSLVKNGGVAGLRKAISAERSRLSNSAAQNDVKLFTSKSVNETVNS